MTTQVQQRGAAQATQEGRVLAAREIDINTTDTRLCVHDGSTVGGMKHVNARDAQNNEFTYAAAAGTNSITATFAYDQAQQAGQGFWILPANNNTGAATFNPNARGAKTIKKVQSGALVDVVADDIVANVPTFLMDNGTYYVLAGGAGGSAAGGGWDITTVDISAVGDVADLLTGIDVEGYVEIVIVGNDIGNSNNPTDLALELGDAGGYETSGYQGYSEKNASRSAQTANIMLCPAWDNGDNSSFVARLWRSSSGTNKWFYEVSFFGDTTGTMDTIVKSGGQKATSGATTKIQIRRITSTGNFNAGTVTVRAR